jgi:hypothetical protein
VNSRVEGSVGARGRREYVKTVLPVCNIFGNLRKRNVIEDEGSNGASRDRETQR